MRTLALPECIDGKPDNAETADDRDGGTRLGQSARLRFTGADLAECPGERTKRRRQNRGTDHVELTRLAAIFWCKDQQDADSDKCERWVDPEHRRPAEGIG